MANRIAQFSSAPVMTRDIRDLKLQEGNPIAFTSLSNQTASNIADSANQGQKFNQAVLELLKTYQSLGTRPFQEAAITGQEEQIRRLQTTPQEFIGASPDLQASVRGAAASAVSPSIQGAQAAGQTFSEQLHGFGDAVSNVRGLVRDFELQEQQRREEAKKNLLFQLELGGSKVFEMLIKENPNSLKLLGIDPKSAEAILPILRTKELLPSEKPITLGPGQQLVNPLTGELIGQSIPERPNFDKFKVELQFKKDFDDQLEVKEFKDINQRFSRMKLALDEYDRLIKQDPKTTKDPKNFVAVDQALITLYNKILDPQSVVREAEYARTAQDVALLNQAKAAFTKLLTGGAQITDAERRALVTMAGKFTGAANNRYDVLRQQAINTALQNDLDPNMIVGPDLDVFGQKEVEVKEQQIDAKDPVNVRDVKFGSPLSRANNNPGNLRFVGQFGATPGKARFARFSTPKAGAQALFGQIELDASRGHTLASFFTKYAPPSENDTARYIQQATRELGVRPGTLLKNINKKKLAQFIAKKESGSQISL